MRFPARQYLFMTYSQTPDATYSREAEREGIRSILSIPLRLNDEVIGVLRMYTAEPVKYTSEDFKFVAAIADQGSNSNKQCAYL